VWQESTLVLVWLVRRGDDLSDRELAKPYGAGAVCRSDLAEAFADANGRITAYFRAWARMDSELRLQS
jgi:hypothetical protein